MDPHTNDGLAIKKLDLDVETAKVFSNKTAVGNEHDEAGAYTCCCGDCTQNTACNCNIYASYLDYATCYCC